MRYQGACRLGVVIRLTARSSGCRQSRRLVSVPAVSGDVVPVSALCGPSGVGQSTLGSEIFSRLSRAGVRTAFLELDQIGLCHPVDDGRRVTADALRAVRPNFRAAAARCLVLSGVVDSAEQARVYASAMPDTAVIFCASAWTRPSCAAGTSAAGGFRTWQSRPSRRPTSWTEPASPMCASTRAG